MEIQINPKELTSAYKLNTKKLREYLDGAFLLGRQLSEIREQLGVKEFEGWMSKNCPEIPWEVFIKRSKEVER